MKFNFFKYTVTFTWVLIVFYWAIYANIPKRSIEYVVKTLPLILLGVWIIESIFKKLNRKN